jgi:hypothetical protein
MGPPCHAATPGQREIGLSEQIWLAQLWAENMLGVLARSRTLYEEVAHLVRRSDLAAAMHLLPLCYNEPVKNHVDAYLWVWGYLRPFAEPGETTRFFQLLHARDPALNLHLYRIVLRHELWYLYNSRLFLDDPCADRLWAWDGGALSLVTLSRSGHELRHWTTVAPSLAAVEDQQALLDQAVRDLLLLKIGGERFWNPKLDRMPGSEPVLRRLRGAGLHLPDRPSRPAAGD